METYPYWQQQTADKPLFPDIEWAKPEQRSQAGRLGIIGGNKLGFVGVAENYNIALAAGIGEARVLLPDALRKSIPSTLTDVIFGPTNQSGGLSADALNELKALGQWATGVLLIGDAGRNSETAILYERFISIYDGPLIITRDSIDLLKSSIQSVVERPKTLIVASFAQLQKIFQSLYYPKVLTFSMQLTNLVEAVHKFTITYPINLMLFFKDTIITASGGQVTTTPCPDPTPIWRGQTATKAAVYWLWNIDKPIASLTASIALPY